VAASADASGVLAPLANASSLPPSYYIDPEQFEVERQTVWTNSWVSVARIEDLKTPGAYVSAVVAGDPVVVTRTADGELNALSNVCPHRGTTIADGSGTARALQCPYHNWTFRLDGTLVTAPGMTHARDFDVDAICLASFAVEVWEGWVFINLSPDAAPLGPQLSTLAELTAQHGLANLRRASTTTQDIPVNWKLVVENFAESYHHAAVHTDTLQRDFPGQKSWLEDNEGGPWTWLDHASTNEAVEPFAVILAFPAHMFSINRGYGMDWIRLEALAVNLTRVHYEVFFPPHQVENQPLIEAFNEMATQVNAEDAAILARVQQGLHSRWAAPGRLSHLEEGCWHFRRWLVEHSQPTQVGETDA